MNTTRLHETHEQFTKRMDVERTELGREIRGKNYWRAAGIAHYLAEQLQERARQRQAETS